MDINILVFVGVGFTAQIIDGALGMAYGVISNTFLLSIGVPPAAASACVHLAEMFITGVSGFSHWRFGNVDWGLVKRLLVPGVFGGVVGAYLLTTFPGDAIKPYVSAYLLVMGLVILIKAFYRGQEYKRVTRYLIPLGIFGGFFDAIGGGGWGPIVTTTLIARDNPPRFTIGSVNMCEFFVTFAESVTFLLTLGLTNPKIVIGLLIGGVIAAPLAAFATRRLPLRFTMASVGILIILLSLRTIISTIL